MIYKTDAKPFASMMSIVWQSYGRSPPPPDVMRYWFNQLEKYPLERVSQSFDRWIDDKNFMPSVSDITILCRADMQLYARLPAPKVSREGQKRLAETVAGFNSKRNYRGWIKNILENPKGRPAIAIKMAEEAAHELQ